MSKIYIEPNIINWARRDGWSGHKLREKLGVLDFEAHFGIHGIYELARGFLYETVRLDAQNNFQILSELDPIFTPTTKMIFDWELAKFKTGALVIPVLDEYNHASAKYQVNIMAYGNIEDEGIKFISRREKAIDDDFPKYVGYQLEAIRHRFGQHVRAEAGAKTISDVFEALDSEVPGLIYQIMRGRVTTSEAARLHARLAEFPGLMTTVRANMYLWAISILNLVGASRDRLDDFRHVIEASYTAAFATEDERLFRAAPRINPGLQVVTWRDISTG